jgi:hypothetical protein
MHRVLLYGAVAAVLSGCVSSGARTSAEGIATRFEQAAGARDGAAACAMLAPETRSSVESSGKARCEEAFGDEDLPSGRAITATDVFGDSARVVLDADTVFLARFGEQWKVTAAGCSDRGEGLPYDCQLSGG